MSKKAEYRYRFDSLVGENGVTIYLNKYKVVKHTKKGVWVEYGFLRDKFIRADARKHFACSTIEEAKKSFIARKSQQLCILESQVEDVRRVLARAAELIEESHGQEDNLQLRVSTS